MLVVLALSLGAQAHEALVEPLPRYPSDGYSDIKACPCGRGANDDRCSVSTALSDPNRSDTVNEYGPGQTITVRLHEVIGHTGRWRVAFDPDGADLADFNANILLDEPDPPGNTGNTGQGDLWEFEVTLPDVECDTCTLQVIQVMNGNPDDPVPDPTGQSTYFQCADLRLVSGATTAPPEDTGPAGTTPAGDTASLSAGEAGGCGCAAAPAPWGVLWAPLALIGWRRSRL